MHSAGLQKLGALELHTSPSLAHNGGDLQAAIAKLQRHNSQLAKLMFLIKRKLVSSGFPDHRTKLIHSLTDFGPQTMRVDPAAYLPNRATSRRCQREQPGDSHMAKRSEISALELYDIVHSFQGTSFNTQFSRNRTSI